MMKSKILFYLSVPVLFTACSPETPVVNVGIDSVYHIERMKKLSLRPELTGSEYCWEVNGVKVADTKDYIFLAAYEGSYDVCFRIIDDDTPYTHQFIVNVLHEQVEYSPYISRVYEYCPAPGQFVNEMPQYEIGDSEADMVQKAEDCISGINDVMVSLGGYGGYITFGFDHTVINRPDEPDFRIWGNCFYELLDTEKRGGSSEPGIVMVSYDSNCNGLPDDPWYELAGSEYNSKSTLHKYNIVYDRPNPDKVPTPDESGNIVDTSYIPWCDSRGVTGYIPKVRFHSQSYWPAWIDSDHLQFEGSLLPPNGVDLSNDGSYYVLYSLPWGYVDNHPNDYTDLNSFDIDNAVDSDGNHVYLPGIDFVRVYTGVNQFCGWLGETSTEISKAADLSIPYK